MLYLISDTAAGVQSSIADVEAQTSQINNLLANTNSSSPTYQSLTTIKSLMDQLASAFSSYLALLNGSGRVRRSEGNHILCIR